MIRVAVQADSALLRAGLETMLGAHQGFELVSDSPDVAVVSVERGGEIPEPPPPVVLLTEAAPSILFHGAGVSALPPQPNEEDLIAAIQGTAAGLVVVHPMLLASRHAALSSDARALVEDLTERELQVLRLMADGLGNKQIAGRLGISDHTAKFHVSSILSKLGGISRTEAVAIGMRSGLIPF